MITQYHSKKIALTLALVTIGLIVVYSGVFLFIKKKQQESILTRQEIALQTERARRLQIVSAFVSGLEEERNELFSYFVTPDGVLNVIQNIEALADQIGVALEITHVDITESEDNASFPVQTLHLTMHATGEWTDIVHVVELLEHLPFESTLQAMELMYRGGVGRQWDATLTLEARLYDPIVLTDQASASSMHSDS